MQFPCCIRLGVVLPRLGIVLQCQYSAVGQVWMHVSGIGSLSASWGASIDNGGSTIDGYKVKQTQF